MDVSDDLLVRQAREGSTDAVAALFDRHWTDAWHVAYAVARSRPAAEDIAQDAFLAAMAALERFDGRRPFRAWLHRIVVNRAIDVVRRERRRVDLDDHALALSSEDRPADPLLAAAVRRLDVDRRIVIVLRYRLDMTPAEIAETLGVRVGTVHSRLARALNDLRAMMEVHDRV